MKKANPYETERYRNEYLLLHYGRDADRCPRKLIAPRLLRFHERIRKECLLSVGKRANTQGLDLGCGVGRFTFELGQVVDEVLGIDNSRSFIQAAQQIAKTGRRSIRVHESGAQFGTCEVVLPAQLRNRRVSFRTGDAMDWSRLPRQGYDVVAAINLICRLPEPRRFLANIHQLVAPGGQLVIASPFTWLPEHTRQREWLSAQDVRDILEPKFRLVRSRELPFVIREHQRKYQLVFSEVMTFRLRGPAGTKNKLRRRSGNGAR